MYLNRWCDRSASLDRLVKGGQGGRKDREDEGDELAWVGLTFRCPLADTMLGGTDRIQFSVLAS